MAASPVICFSSVHEDEEFLQGLSLALCLHHPLGVTLDTHCLLTAQTRAQSEGNLMKANEESLGGTNM